MEESLNLLKRAARFASVALAPIPSSCVFHTLEHTKQVVRAARVIGRASKLDSEQLNIVQIAAWFHEVGYDVGAECFEERSASIAVSVLSKWGANSKVTADVSRCIIATRHPQDPKDILGMVLCDADLAHLGSPQYERYLLRLRIGQEESLGRKLESRHVWQKRTIDFLKAHHYFTEYGQDILDKRKKVNFNKIIGLQRVTSASNFETHQMLSVW